MDSPGVVAKEGEEDVLDLFKLSLSITDCKDVLEENIN